MNQPATTVKKYALMVADKDGNVLFTIAHRNCEERLAHAFRSFIAIFTGTTVI